MSYSKILIIIIGLFLSACTVPKLVNKNVEDLSIVTIPMPEPFIVRDGVFENGNKNMGRMFAAIGGAFLGMISVGLAELQEYHLVAKCKVPTRVAVATSIFVVVICINSTLKRTTLQVQNASCPSSQ